MHSTTSDSIKNIFFFVEWPLNFVPFNIVNNCSPVCNFMKWFKQNYIYYSSFEMPNVTVFHTAWQMQQLCPPQCIHDYLHKKHWVQWEGSWPLVSDILRQIYGRPWGKECQMQPGQEVGVWSREKPEQFFASFIVQKGMETWMITVSCYLIHPAYIFWKLIVLNQYSTASPVLFSIKNKQLGPKLWQLGQILHSWFSKPHSSDICEMCMKPCSFESIKGYQKET